MKSLAVIALLCIASVAVCQPCGTRFVCPTPIVSTPYVAPTVERIRYVDDAQVLVFVPTFTVSYQPPLPYPPGIGGQLQGGYGAAVAPQVQAQNTQGFQECLAAITKISARLDAIEVRMGGGSAPRGGLAIPPADPTPTDGLARTETRATIIKTSCAACHTAGKLDPETKFVLVDEQGKLATLTAEQEVKVYRQVYSAEMPPKGNKKGIAPLTDEQVKKLIFP